MFLMSVYSVSMSYSVLEELRKPTVGCRSFSLFMLWRNYGGIKSWGVKNVQMLFLISEIDLGSNYFSRSKHHQCHKMSLGAQQVNYSHHFDRQVCCNTNNKQDEMTVLATCGFRHRLVVTVGTWETFLTGHIMIIIRNVGMKIKADYS